MCFSNFHLITPKDQWGRWVTAKDTEPQKGNNSCTVTKIVIRGIEIWTHNKHNS